MIAHIILKKEKEGRYRQKIKNEMTNCMMMLIFKHNEKDLVTKEKVKRNSIHYLRQYMGSCRAVSETNFHVYRKCTSGG